MKIKNIEKIGKKPVYDLSVENVEHYILENGVVTHNTGVYYSSDNIWIVGRSQEKEGTDVAGYHFNIAIEKSRYVREKSKIPITVMWEGGINKWSGLMDVALSANYIAKPSNGWYQRVDRETGELVGQKYRAKEIVASKEFWEKVFTETDFAEYIRKAYSVGETKLLSDDNIEENGAVVD